MKTWNIIVLFFREYKHTVYSNLHRQTKQQKLIQLFPFILFFCYCRCFYVGRYKLSMVYGDQSCCPVLRGTVKHFGSLSINEQVSCPYYFFPLDSVVFPLLFDKNTVFKNYRNHFTEQCLTKLLLGEFMIIIIFL